MLVRATSAIIASENASACALIRTIHECPPCRLLQFRREFANYSGTIRIIFGVYKKP